MSDTASGTTDETVAAIDLGSNSFHMIVVRRSANGLQIIDRLREPVRLGAGLDEARRLDEDTEARALTCLERFGERLRGIPTHRVRTVGTNTLRRMRRAGPFLTKARAALGHPVEIISGVEEARLVYGGVTHGMPDDDSRRLVIDIGGGSTELIIGHGATPDLMESVRLGCVSHTREHFADGRITRRTLQQARLAAASELEFLERRYRRAGWDMALGASGSIRAVWRVGAALGLGDNAVTPKSIAGVLDVVRDAGHIDKLECAGLREDRRPVFAGSLTVLAAIFDVLEIERMEISDRALREGVLYDLFGRLEHHDVRADSVTAMAERFQVDREHAARVAACAEHIFSAVAQTWAIATEPAQRFLNWCAQLHEIGLAISHSGYHKHSQYILGQADLHGFSRTDQQVLAAITRLHRGKIKPDLLDDLREDWIRPARLLTAILRLAVLLNRSRDPDTPPLPEVSVDKRSLTLTFSAGWLAGQPLTQADLADEAERLRALNIKLKFA